MMQPTKWYRELIAHSSPQRGPLCEPQMMGVARRAAAQQAGLRRNELNVVSVAMTPRLREMQRAFVDRIVFRSPPPRSPAGCFCRLIGRAGSRVRFRRKDCRARMISFELA